MWNLSFISKDNFKKHVKETIKEYDETLKSIDLRKFNRNIVDPIKLLFDSKVYGKSYEEIINEEIARQRDKTNNNTIRIFPPKVF